MIPCATCATKPIGTYPDGSPRYGCGPHDPIAPGDPVHPEYLAAMRRGDTVRTIVELDEAEMGQAEACGRKRLQASKRKKREDYLGKDSLVSHVMGAQGERAFAKWIGEPWDCTLNRFRGAADVRGCQIRTVPKTSERLKVRADDPDRIPVVLVVAHPPRFWLRGWLFAAEVRRAGVVDDPGLRNRPAHFIDPGLLRPMSELLTHDRARAAMGLPPMSVSDAVSEASA